jgi:hypothetical protein
VISRSRLEASVLAGLAAALALGLVAARVDPRWFEQAYVVEDGPVEWATFAVLLASAAAAAWTLRHPPASRGRLHAVTWLGLTILCVFAAGEEISWGQRVLGFSSSEFFVHQNAQHETNLHNLVVAGVKVNKLVFSQLMYGTAALYLLVLPLLHRRSAAVRRAADALAVPVPRLRHAATIACCFAVTAMIASHRRDELLELGMTTAFLLILVSPANVAALRALGPRGAAGDAAAGAPPASGAFPRRGAEHGGP